MRHSSLLLALVASAAAHDDARLRWLVGEDVVLNSRTPTEGSGSLDARHAALGAGRAEKGMLRSRRVKRDDDDYKDYREYWADQYKDQMEDQDGPSGDPPVPNRINDANDDDNEDHSDDSENENPSKDGHHSKNGDHSDDSDDDENHGTRGGVVAGGVIGGLAGLLVILSFWYCLRIRPRRKQRIAEEAARRQEELEKGLNGSDPSIHSPQQETGTIASSSPSDGAAAAAPRTTNQYVPTPFPGRAPSVNTGSSISGLALPTPALTYSPSATTVSTATPNLPPSHSNPLPHTALAEKPPAYAAVLALQSSEPQPEASAYQMGQVPMPTEPTVYQLPSDPQPGATDMRGAPISRY
ncbi:hypothetical protein GGR52DRAFT_344947 [Hypoxylon sp. FL1284]|nr:hypothetical protein GGR52DRAFT_344947 [Hypoxylon sp. FL1284]